MKNPKFKVGDTVRRKSGVDPQVVTKVVKLDYEPFYKYFCQYTKSGIDHYPKGQYASQLELVLSCKTPKEEKETKMGTLYEYTNKDGSKKFVHYLATNSNGEWVVEEKGSGSVFSDVKDKFFEVVPYTVDIAFIDFDSVYPDVASFTSSKGKFKVGDVLAMGHTCGLSIAIVKAVDTKSKEASEELKPLGRFTMERFDEE